MMRITTTFAAATALSVAILAAACEDRPTDPSDVTAPPSFGVVDNGWEPFTWYWWACNEPVTIEGKVHFTWSVQENDNRWHWRWHANLIGSGVGEYSGSTYRLSEAYDGRENVAAGWTYPLTVSYTDHLTLVGQGPTTDLHGSWQWHVTVNANGVETAVVDKWRFTCDGRGPPPLEGKLVVNVTDDLYDGSCDATHCSLRDALIASNSYSGTDTIVFRIPGSGPHTIQPRYGLPEAFDPVVIDGTTEPNFAGTPIVELDGSLAGWAHGLTVLGSGSTVRGLVINRFEINGILIHGSGASQNIVEGNFIGLDVAGVTSRGNGLHGVSIVDAPGNTVGGTAPAARNVISGNAVHGVEVIFAGATGNLVQGNYIGTDLTGTAAVGNGAAGVMLVEAAENVIGSASGGRRNIVSGNTEGINIWGATAYGNVVQGNHIGTDPSGTLAVGNVIGVKLSGPNNMIGGLTEGAHNVISGNGGIGILIQGGEASGNQIAGNYIGTDATGTVALGNSSSGVVVNGSNGNLIGGAWAGARNVISGNLLYGVQIGAGASQNHVQGNYIGTQSDGSSPLGNSRHGVVLARGASDNTIGGVGVTLGMCNGSCNTIAFNGLPGTGYDGVRVMSGTGNLVIGNATYSNASLGIDLGADGFTPNDPGDGDTGANELQNFPELFAVYGAQTSITIEGALNSTPATTFRLEFFANNECDPSGYGEGETFIGATTVVTDGNGDMSFTVTFPTTLQLGTLITATATDPDNNTSEFSACVEKT